MLQQWVLAIEGCVSLIVGKYDYLLFGHLLAEGWQIGQTTLVNQQAIECIAYRNAAGLGIIDNGFTHLDIALGIEICVDYTCTCLDDRDAGCVADKIDEFTTATGYAEVYIAHSVKHLACGLVSGWQQGYNILGYTMLLQYLVYQCHLFTVAAIGILTALKHTGVTALKAEREYIECDIGTSLVDHADNAEGHAYTAQTQTIRQRLLFGDMAQGRG